MVVGQLYKGLNPAVNVINVTRYLRGLAKRTNLMFDYVTSPQVSLAQNFLKPLTPPCCFDVGILFIFADLCFPDLPILRQHS